MMRQMFRKLAALVGLAAVAQMPARPQRKIFDIPTPSEFPHAPVPKMRSGGSKRPESWHRLCRKRAQYYRDLRDGNNAIRGPLPFNHQRMKLAQAKARRLKAELAA